MDIFKDFADIFNVGLLHLLNVFSLIAVFDAARRIFLKQFTKHVFIMATIGTMYCLGSIGYSYFWSNLLTDLETPRLESLKKQIPLPDDFAIELPVVERAKLTESIAELYFKEFGEYIRVINLDGDWQPFIPTRLDIKAREEKVAQSVELKHLIGNHEAVGKYWLVSFFIAIVLGWVAAHPKFSRQLWFGS